MTEAVLTPNEYRCAMCYEVFENGWSDEEARAEKDEHFADIAMDDCDLVCDVCYQAVRPDRNPEQFARYRGAVGTSTKGKTQPAVLIAWAKDLAEQIIRGVS